ncbi:MAG TPA: PHP domain-containing protein [Candidatus Sulfotelmatobacter sp.]|nr:PHP domain-containing protein [Candidatus Sulfotelmatobacter sp.]
MLKAALHVHSTYSDGEFTLAELKRIFTHEGCSVVGITDHADSFHEQKLADYTKECADLSDDQFLFLCGLEYSCEQKMHILGYGTTALVQTADPQKVIAAIEGSGGVSVIAHPKDSMFAWIENLSVLPRGIETWNSKYDGRYAPRPATFELLRRLRTLHPEMHAFFGQDLHWTRQYRGLFTHLYCDSPHREDVVKAMSQGNYVGSKGTLQLPSTGELTPELAAQFTARHAQSSRMRSAIGWAKRMVDRVGIKPPASLKSHLRKIF